MAKLPPPCCMWWVCRGRAPGSLWLELGPTRGMLSTRLALCYNMPVVLTHIIRPLANLGVRADYLHLGLPRHVHLSRWPILHVT